MFKRIIILPIIILGKSAKNSINLFLILIVSLSIFNSCSDSSNPGLALPFGDDFTYPLNVGNKWSYDREWLQYNFRTADMNPDPTRNDTTINSIIEVTIDREETIADSIQTFVLTTSEVLEGRNFFSENYYNNKEDGLYKFGYKGLSGTISYPKISQQTIYKFNGLSFSSKKELSVFLIDRIYPIEEDNSDSLIFHVPPIQTLKLPLEINDLWNYVNNTIRIDKKVISKELVDTPIGTFECYKIQWLYTLPNIEIYDFISSKGLVKRTLLVKNLIISTTSNPDGNGFMDVKDEMILTGINF